MQQGVVLYFKKQAQAWVAMAEGQKVVLPKEAVRIREGEALRVVQQAERQPRPHGRAEVVFEVDPHTPQVATQWALA